MPFKELYLKREEIPTAISSFCEGVTFTRSELNGSEKFHVNISGIETVLHFYYRTDGKTTIALNEGSNQELGEKLAKHIVSTISFDKRINAPIYIKNLSQESFNMLEEYLIDFCDAEKVSITPIPSGTKYEFKSKYGDKIHLNYFNTGSFNVQGRCGLLKSQVMEGLSNYLDYGEIVEATLESYDVKDLDKPKVEKLYEARLPNAYKMLSNTVKSIILPTFITERLDITTTDYTFMVFPILRGIEGFMKQLLESKGIMVNKNFGEVFDKDSTGKVIIKNSLFLQINCIFISSSLLKMYLFHFNNRHALFHVDGHVDSTYLIGNITDAKSLINESVELVEKCAATIANKDLKYLK